RARGGPEPRRGEVPARAPAGRESAPPPRAAPAPRGRRAGGRGGAPGSELEPRRAWTPVGECASRGLDAINLGPGATRFAHRRDEQVEVAALVRSFEALQRFLTA